MRARSARVMVRLPPGGLRAVGVAAHPATARSTDHLRNTRTRLLRCSNVVPQPGSVGLWERVSRTAPPASQHVQSDHRGSEDGALLSAIRLTFAPLLGPLGGVVLDRHRRVQQTRDVERAAFRQATVRQGLVCVLGVASVVVVRTVTGDDTGIEPRRASSPGRSSTGDRASDGSFGP